MRRLWPLFLIAVVVLVSVAWLTLREGPGDLAPVRPGEESERTPSGPPDSAPAEPEAPPVSVHLANGRYVLEGRVYRDDVPAKAVVEIRLVLAGERRRNVFEGIELGAPRPAGPALAALTTRENGRFQFPGLAPGLYELRAEAEDGALALCERWCALGRNPQPVRLDLVPVLESLSGRAIHADGTPFDGVVWAGNVRLGATKTDADGRFRLDGLPAGTLGLSLLAPGRLLVTREVVLPRDGELTVVVDEGFEDVRGRVVSADDESAVSGALVGFQAHDPGMSQAAAITGADGGFALRSVGRAAFVRVSAEGFAPLRCEWRRGADEIFRLLRAGGIRGHVIAATSGVSAPGIDVFQREAQSFGASQRTQTGPDGRFSFDGVAPGEIEIYALGNGWVSEGLLSRTSWEVNPLIHEVASGGTAEVEIRVVRSGRIEGRVLDAERKPIPGVVVAAETPGGWRGFRNTDSTVTDPGGRYSFESLIPGFPYELTAIPRESPPIVSGPHSAASGETLTIDLVAPRPRWIEIEVVESLTGKPVVTAGVAVRQDGGAQHFVTDDAGRVRVGPIGPGEARVRVDHGHYLCTTTPYVVPAEGPDRLTVRLDRGLFLAGRLVVDGEATGAYRLSIASPPGINIFELYGVGSSYAPEDDGSFRIGPLPPGKYALTVRDSHYRERLRQTCVAGREDLVIRVPAAPAPAGPPAPDGKPDHGEFVVLVRGPDGRPPSSGRVDIRTDGAVREIEQTPSRVRYRIRKPGRNAWIHVSFAEDATGAPLGTVLHGPVELRPGEITVVLPNSRTVEGRVVGLDGKGIKGLSVYARVADTRSPFRHSRQGLARTSDEGRFRLEGLGVGKCDISVNVPEDYATPAPVTVVPGAEAVEIRLAAAGRLSVHVEDEEGRPVARVPVRAVLLPDRDEPVSGWTQATGMAELTRLQPGGTYRIRVVNVAGGKAGRVAEARVGETDVEIRLAPGVAITGRFDVPEGAKRFEVYASLDDIMVHGKVGVGGRFEIRGLTDERWKVSAFAAGAGKSWAGEAEAMAGEDVTIALHAR